VISLREHIETIAAELSRAGYPLELDFGALPYRPSEPRFSVPDISRWVGETGWRAQIDLTRGVSDQVAQELARWD
jgi:nucleoside-diphosphate-sugar epimerase